MRLVPSVLLLALCGAATGCRTERVIRVTSDPPGARIRLDDTEVGTTPARIEFDHYGVRRITLYKEGYHTHSEQIELDPPWYSRFPLDLVSEILLPFGWKDKRRYHVALEAGEERMKQPLLRSVIERAAFLRNAGLDGPRELPDPEPRELPPMEDDAEGAQEIPATIDDEPR